MIADSISTSIIENLRIFYEDSEILRNADALGAIHVKYAEMPDKPWGLVLQAHVSARYRAPLGLSGSRTWIMLVR